jgi:hypothetical protein
MQNDIFLSVNSDGGNTEGIGSMVQYQLFVYALAKNLNLGYAFFGFKNLQHYQHHEDYTQDSWCKKINGYFNLPNELIDEDYKLVNLNLNQVSDFINFLNSNKSNDKKVVINIRQWDILKLDVNSYKSYFLELSKRIKHDTLLNEDKNHISIHIRSENKMDSLLEPSLDANREFFDSSKIDFYKNIIQKINNIPSKKQKKYHIHSQIKENDLLFIKDIVGDKNIQFYNNVYPWISLSCMIQSNVLVASKSSFSYIAHLLNKNKCLFRNNFWQNLYKETILVDNKGNF